MLSFESMFPSTILMVRGYDPYSSPPFTLSTKLRARTWITCSLSVPATCLKMLSLIKDKPHITGVLSKKKFFFYPTDAEGSDALVYCFISGMYFLYKMQFLQGLDLIKCIYTAHSTVRADEHVSYAFQSKVPEINLPSQLRNFSAE